jgi:hypothetical protein
MNTTPLSATELRTFWRCHLEQWQHSGLTQIEYCRQQDVSRDRFSYWKKRLLPAQAPGPTPLAGPGFLRVQVASGGARVAVVLDGRLRVEVQPGFDPATLRAVVQALSPDVPA